MELAQFSVSRVGLGSYGDEEDEAAVGTRNRGAHSGSTGADNSVNYLAQI